MEKTNQTLMKRKILITAGIVVALIVAVLTAGSFYLSDYAFSVSSETRDLKSKWTQMENDYPALHEWFDSIRQDGVLRDTFMVMPSGERHHALFVRDPRAKGRTAILVHGYHDASVRMLPIASIYSRMGYNILLPDLHGHGLSEGDNVRMGWLDREDVMRWMAAAERMFRTDSCRSAMVVHGVSMGAATTMCVSGETQADYVRCFVEDCGYTSVWDELECELRDQFGLPAFPMLYMSSALTKLRYGWSFGEASPLRQVAKSRLPMLFIHGDADDYVPTWMVYPLFKAKAQPIGKDGKVDKELWIAKGTQHALAYHDYPEEYSRRVREFVTRCVGR